MEKERERERERERTDSSGHGSIHHPDESKRVISINLFHTKPRGRSQFLPAPDPAVMNLLHAIITITSQLRSVLALHQPNKTTAKRQQKDPPPPFAICHLPLDPT